MNWIIIIPLILLVISLTQLLIISLNQSCLFFQVLCAFTSDHETWKRYRRLKKYLKTDTIPLIDARDYEGGNSGFAFIQYDNLICVIQGDYLYLSSFYNHLIDDLLKRNNQ
jgi:alkyl sulfatase BDS1-like metallo-beta-lactamase superfamily hydrolase